ncbi:hypothetical protein, partial [Kitasatospora sp. NE20-6]|uniref:hypothetical protein n=1 Tax=Kitasatospora sp. NE20-6 TaxID=2859066 RepID=UPI0038B39FB5
MICGFEDGDVEAGDGPAAVRAAVVLPLGVSGHRRADLAGADAGPAGWEEAGKDAPADDTDGAGVRERGDAGGLDGEVAGGLE